jgi:hypothetical protein
VADVSPPFTYEDALSWVDAHTPDRRGLPDLRRDAHTLGPAAVPALLVVLARGTPQQSTVARAALTVVGVGIEPQVVGGAPTYRVTHADGSTEVVAAERVSAEPVVMLTSPWTPVGPPRHRIRVRTMLLGQAACLLVAAAIAFGGSRTSGVASIALYAVAAIVAVTTLWALLFLAFTALFLLYVDRVRRRYWQRLREARGLD